jgi:hypothetical protein
VSGNVRYDGGVASFTSFMAEDTSARAAFRAGLSTAREQVKMTRAAVDATFQIPRSTAGDGPQAWVYGAAGFLVASLTAGIMLLAMHHEHAAPAPPVAPAPIETVAAASLPPAPVAIAPMVIPAVAPTDLPSAPAPAAPTPAKRTARKR